MQLFVVGFVGVVVEVEVVALPPVETAVGSFWPAAVAAEVAAERFRPHSAPQRGRAQKKWGLICDRSQTRLGQMQAVGQIVEQAGRILWDLEKKNGKSKNNNPQKLQSKPVGCASTMQGSTNLFPLGKAFPDGTTVRMLGSRSSWGRNELKSQGIQFHRWGGGWRADLHRCRECTDNAGVEIHAHRGK